MFFSTFPVRILQTPAEFFITSDQKLHCVKRAYLCLVLLHVPKCFWRVQIFFAKTKIYLNIVAVTNILCQITRWFAFSKIVFCVGTKVFEEALNAFKFLGWLKKFGLAQIILGPVKVQGINLRKFLILEVWIKSPPKNVPNKKRINMLKIVLGIFWGRFEPTLNNFCD